MHNIQGNRFYLMQRNFNSMTLPSEDGYRAIKNFDNINEVIRYLYEHYDAERRRYYFDGNVDVTGEDTTQCKKTHLSEDGELVEVIVYAYRKRWMFAEELNSDWLNVINPYAYQREVNKLVDQYGSKKQAPVYRQEPIPRAGKRIRYIRSVPETPVKHTAWYREEKARQTMDKEWDQGHYRLPEPNYQDWNFYHKHSPREGKSWKNKKVLRQWMKNVNQ